MRYQVQYRDELLSRIAGAGAHGSSSRLEIMAIVEPNRMKHGHKRNHVGERVSTG